MFNIIDDDIKEKIEKYFKYDLVLIINDKEYQIHKNILCDYYEYFASYLNINNENPIIINLNMINGKISDHIIEFCLNHIYQDYTISLYKDDIYYKYIKSQLHENTLFKYNLLNRNTIQGIINDIQELYYLLDYWQIKKETNLWKETKDHINNYLTSLNIIGTISKCSIFKEECHLEYFNGLANINMKLEGKYLKISHETINLEKFTNSHNYSKIFWIHYIVYTFSDKDTYIGLVESVNRIVCSIISSELYDFFNSKFKLDQEYKNIAFIINHHIGGYDKILPEDYYNLGRCLQKYIYLKNNKN